MSLHTEEVAVELVQLFLDKGSLPTTQAQRDQALLDLRLTIVIHHQTEELGPAHTHQVHKELLEADTGNPLLELKAHLLLNQSNHNNLLQLVLMHLLGPTQSPKSIVFTPQAGESDRQVRGSMDQSQQTQSLRLTLQIG